MTCRNELWLNVNLLVGRHKCQTIILLSLTCRALNVIPDYLRLLSHPHTGLTVFLHDAAVHNAPSQRPAQLSAWGINVISGDFSMQSEKRLAAVFRPFDAVINCGGFVGGTGTQPERDYSWRCALFPW